MEPPFRDARLHATPEAEISEVTIKGFYGAGDLRTRFRYASDLRDEICNIDFEVLGTLRSTLSWRTQIQWCGSHTATAEDFFEVTAVMSQAAVALTRLSEFVSDLDAGDAREARRLLQKAIPDLRQHTLKALGVAHGCDAQQEAWDIEFLKTVQFWVAGGVLAW